MSTLLIIGVPPLYNTQEVLDCKAFKPKQIHRLSELICCQIQIKFTKLGIHKLIMYMGTLKMYRCPIHIKLLNTCLQWHSPVFCTKQVFSLKKIFCYYLSKTIWQTGNNDWTVQTESSILMSTKN